MKDNNKAAGFESGCQINRQQGTNVEHSRTDNNLQKVFLSEFIYHLNR